MASKTGEKTFYGAKNIKLNFRKDLLSGDFFTCLKRSGKKTFQGDFLCGKKCNKKNVLWGKENIF